MLCQPWLCRRGRGAKGRGIPPVFARNAVAREVRRGGVMRSSILRTASTLVLAIAPLGLAACGGSNGSSTHQDFGVVQSSLSRDMSPQVAPSDLQKLADRARG